MSILKKMDKYFAFSKNIIAVNCIHTDIQDRANGMDEDSDFMLVTNQSTMVKCAERCYRDFYTIVNALQESGITYNNTKKIMLLWIISFQSHVWESDIQVIWLSWQ